MISELWPVWRSASTSVSACGWAGGPALEFSPSYKLAHRLEEQMRLLSRTFSPLFFVMVGVSPNLSEINWGSASIWSLAGSLLLVSLIGKFAAGFFIREPRRNQVAIGLSMIPPFLLKWFYPGSETPADSYTDRQ